MGNAFSCDPLETGGRRREHVQKPNSIVTPATPPPAEGQTDHHSESEGEHNQKAQSVTEYKAAVTKTVKKAWPLLIAASLRTKVYAFVVPAMAINFFPGNPGLAWACFSIPMVFRPFGGILFGHIADRWGRKPASKAAVWVVFGAVTAQAFNPSGMIHPSMQALGTIFLITARSIQGIGVGGIPAAQTWVTELSDKRCLAMTSAMTQASSNTCYCLCAVMLFTLSATLSDYNFNLYGWRVGVLMSAAPEVVALMYMDEVMDTFSPAMIDKDRKEDAEEQVPQEKPLNTVFAKYKTNSLICFINVTAVNLMQFCCSNMLPYFLIQYCAISQASAYLITFTSEVSCIWGSMVAGAMSDFFGLGKEAVIGSGIAAAYLVVAFEVVTSHPGQFWPAFILFGPMNALCSSLACATVQTYVCEAYPKHCRASGTATVNNSSMVISAAAPVIFDSIAYSSPHMVGLTMAAVMVSRMATSWTAYVAHNAGKLRLAHIRGKPY